MMRMRNGSLGGVGVHERGNGYLRRSDYRVFFPVAIASALLGWAVERFGSVAPTSVDVVIWLGAAAGLAVLAIAFWARAVPRHALEMLLCGGIGGLLLFKLAHVTYAGPSGGVFGREIAEFAPWIPTYFGMCFLWFGIRTGRRISVGFLLLLVAILIPAYARGGVTEIAGLYVLGGLCVAGAVSVMVLNALGRVVTRGDEERRAMEHLTLLDELTGVANRRGLMERLREELGRAERYSTYFSVLLLDIDHFKQINDRHGHLVGDAALTDLARVLVRESRKVDTVGRWGGEEFMLILPSATKGQATTLASRLRYLISEHDFGDPGGLTVSVGVSSHRKGDTVDDLVKRADDALYRAKEEGRNRVVTAQTRIT